MSSIVISGDISGTVTLDAPSTAGTTVLTLPSTSGTVVTTATTTGISGSAITTGTVGVSVGGTGANTLTANNVILGNGTSAVQFVAPGSSGNVLTSNGTTWTSAAAGGGSLQTQIFTSPGTWTRPSTVTQVKVTVIGGGCGAGQVGGGFDGSPGGTSSFGSLVSATGGVWQNTPGVGTVSTGTAIKNGGAIYGSLSFDNQRFQTRVSIGDISGGVLAGGLGGNPTYSSNTPFMAGACGQGSGPGTGPGVNFFTNGFGGLAIATCPVSSPVPVTVGTGGAFNPTFGNCTAGSGMGGVVVVEFVG